MNQEENVIGCQPALGEQLNSEEVHARHDRHVRSNEILPADRLAALERGSEAVTLQNIADSLIGDAVAEIRQRTHNSVIPVWSKYSCGAGVILQ